MKDEHTIINSLKKEVSGAHNRASNPLVVRSPGRINLIGEHTDYNNGFVLPSAIDRAIYLVVQPRRGYEVRLRSLDYREECDFDVRNPARSTKAWANYLIGTVNELKRLVHIPEGFDCAFSGNIPIGAGMSSSAALEAGLAYALDKIFSLGLEKMELARLAQRAENDFVGVRCGIMDQFANLFSNGDSVLHLDCRSMEYEYIPFLRKDLRFVLCDTGVKHSLASSEYNMRRQQCETGVRLIMNHAPEVKSLRDVTAEMLHEYEGELGSTVHKRCCFVVEENSRVEAASRYLERNDYAKFGDLLYESHHGLKDKFEVSCTELDLLVDEASGIDGVLGARMMGGGFGGCTLNLVEHNAVEEFKAKISENYRKTTGQMPHLYECVLMPGTDVVID